MKVLRFLDDNLEKMLCTITLALMSAIIVLQVFFRYVLNNSLAWSEELARYLFIWTIYIGISYGVGLVFNVLYSREIHAKNGGTDNGDK